MSKLVCLTICVVPWVILAVPADALGGPDHVVVAVDLDPDQPGFQTTLTVPPGTVRVEGVAIWIYDPTGRAVIRGVGYVGGLNRGIAFGHVPDPGNGGAVTALTGTAVEPVVAGHSAFLDGGVQPMFAGPEVQYFEAGPAGAIPAAPGQPVMTVDIDLADAQQGDVFRFHLGDMTAAWLDVFDIFDGGAFSTTDAGSLDAGGDAVPDGTESLLGLDADVAAPSPPAPFTVDYVDGDGGATIVVAGAAVPAASSMALVAMAGALLGAGVLVLRRRIPGAA